MSAHAKLLPKNDAKARALKDAVDHVIRGTGADAVVDGSLVGGLARDLAQLSILLVLVRGDAPHDVALGAWLEAALPLVTLDAADAALVRADIAAAGPDVAATLQAAIPIDGPWSRFDEAVVDEVTTHDDDVLRAAALLALALIC